MRPQTVSIIAVFVAAAVTQAIDIPQLNWIECSDWVNVKTDITPAAKGDGMTDDAAAIQRCLDSAVDQYGNPQCVVYLPAGRYRITRTLRMPSSVGLMVVGNGRDTRIEWAGPADSAMLVTMGSVYASYIGIAWDGKGTAGSGICHHAPLRFEHSVLHEHEAFYNFRQAGIRTSDRADFNAGTLGYATSESVVRNCLFSHDTIGIALSFFNYYNWNVVGCEFQSCNRGIVCVDYGQVYVNACHFEGSLFRDLELSWSHSNSVRNCTSHGSNLFLWGQDMTMQNCAVDGWIGGSGWITAILNNSLGPFLVSDCGFSNAPYASPPVYMQEANSGLQLAYSNIVSPASSTPVSVNGNSATEIPRGSRPAGSTLAGTRSFLRETFAVPAKVYDVKTFGAGGSNDAAAFQRAIDSARAYGRGAMVYIPHGAYTLAAPVVVSGANYWIQGAGAGYGSRISLSSPNAAFEIRGAGNVKIQHLDFSGTGMPIHHIGGSGSTGRVAYDMLSGPYEGATVSVTGNQGLVVTDLASTDTVIIDKIDMSLRATNCGKGILVADFVDNGAIIEGTQPVTGFVGVNEINGRLIVRNNHSFVAGDVYLEQSDLGTGDPTYNAITVSGGPADPPGNVTIGVSRGHFCDTDSLVRLRNFAGLLFLGQGNLDASDCPTGRPGLAGYKIGNTGTAPVTLVFCANYLSDALQAQQVTFGLNSASRLIAIENKYMTNAIPAGGLDSAAKSLGHFAELNQRFLSLNFASPNASIDRRATGEDRMSTRPAFAIAHGRLKVGEKAIVRMYDLQGRIMAAASVDEGVFTIPRRTAGTAIVTVESAEGRTTIKFAGTK